jgi:phage-related protein
MTDTFTTVIPPQEEPNVDVRFNVIDTQFGEGYIQTFVEGMNTIKDVWPVTWVGTDTEINPIKTFFEAHPGVSFNWTPPGKPQNKYRVKGYQYIPSAAGNAKISAILERFFTP